MTSDLEPILPASPPESPGLKLGGQVAGRFEIEALAGAGGMGEVARAWDRVLERWVALKSVRQDFLKDPDYRERLKREALAMAQVNHPTICQIYDWVEDGASAYLAMEWVEGRTLEEAKAAVPPPAMLRILAEALKGLEAAHAKGLVHRDLKPGNIMLTPEGAVKLMDFGLALAQGEEERPFDTPSKVPMLSLLQDAETTGPRARSGQVGRTGSRGSLTRKGFFMGSPAYSSPEQIQGLPLGPSSDMFCFGILAWEMLTGAHPFPYSGNARMLAIAEGRRAALPKGKQSRPIRRLLLALLSLDPLQRPTASAALHQIERELRPRASWQWAALSALLVFSLGGAGLWLYAKGVVRDLSRRHPARLAILPMEGHGLDPKRLDELCYALPEWVGSLLAESSRLSVMPEERILPALKERGEARNRALLKAGVQLVLSSEAHIEGPNLVVTAQLVDLQGKIRATSLARHSDEDPTASQWLARHVAKSLLAAVDPLGVGRSPDRMLPPEAIRYFGQGLRLRREGKPKEALEAFTLSTTMAAEFAPASLQQGILEAQLGLPGSRSTLQWARFSARLQNLRRAEMRALLNLVLDSYERNQFAVATKDAEEGLALARLLGDQDDEAALMNNLGLVHLGRRDRSEAKRWFESALPIEQSLGHGLEVAAIQNNLATIAKDLGDLELAERLYQRNLTWARSEKDLLTEGRALINLGDIALGRLRFAESATFLKAGMAIREAQGSRPGLVVPSLNLGILARLQEQPAEARRWLLRACALAAEFQRKSLEAIGHLELAKLERAAQNPLAARLEDQKALALAEASADPEGQANALAGLAEDLLPRQIQEAQRLLARAEALNTDTYTVPAARAAWFQAQDRRAEARTTLQMAIQLAGKSSPEEVPALQRQLVALGFGGPPRP